MRVAVCALTLQRPEGLRRLLGHLAALRTPDPPAEVEVVIVDNDPCASARPVVDRARDEFPWPLRYEVEPRRGIPFARNRAVAVALASGADHVAFIDDDEMPEPGWLDELLRVQRSTGAEVVTGPVVPVFAEPPPRWAVEGRFFERPRFTTGEAIRYARTSNVLIAAGALAPHPRPFHEGFALSGGSDTHFFMRARLEGRRIVWADEAVVRELVPASRVDPAWLRRRAYRRGTTLSLSLLDLQDTPVRRARRVALGVLEVGKGVAAAAVAPFLAGGGGRVGVERGVDRAAFGVGLLAGLAGRRFDEYRTIHGG